MAERLKAAASPYLQSAAPQPVDWYPWGPEAFERARREDKPILLDIGAAWCHWCHVIDHESYEDPQVAELINQHFVAIKVDRDERPDVDARYQHAVAAISGQGGWPLTAFLTPQGRVFFGGTYFPPVDVQGRPSFSRILRSVAAYYRENREEAERMSGELHSRLAPAMAQVAPGELDAGLVAGAITDISRAFDATNGGFGRAPKFPHTSTIELLIRRAFHSGDETLRSIVSRTLEKMGRGGIYDQLGGGFHRYSTDARWVVPHFEKMLYDNAGLLANYVRGHQLTGSPVCREVALGLYGYMSDVLYDHHRGGFHASQDADVGPHDDGDYFTWTLEEARAALSPDEFRVLVLHYDIDEHGEMHHDPSRNVLHVDKDSDVVASLTGIDLEQVRALIASGKRRLLEARATRSTPFVDRTIYANWNAMGISAFFEVFKGLALDEARTLALRALDRILADLYQPGRGIYHMLTPDGPAHAGFLDDQAQVALACLDAFEVTGEGRYLAAARDLAEVMLREHEDPAGGFNDLASGADDPALTSPNKPIQDSPTPSSNAVAALALTRLSRLLDDRTYREAAERTLRAFAGGVAGQGLFASTYFLALDDFLNEPAHVVVVRLGADGAAGNLHAAALRAFRPDKIVTLYQTEGGSALPEPVRAMAAAATETRAYVCAGNACAPPTSDPDELVRLILSFHAGPPAH